MRLRTTPRLGSRLPPYRVGSRSGPMPLGEASTQRSPRPRNEPPVPPAPSGPTRRRTPRCPRRQGPREPGATGRVHLALSRRTARVRVAVGRREDCDGAACCGEAKGVSPIALAMVRNARGRGVFPALHPRGAASLRADDVRAISGRILAGLSIIGIALEPDALPARAANDDADDGRAARRDDPGDHGRRWRSRGAGRSGPAGVWRRGSVHPSRGSHGSPASGTSMWGGSSSSPTASRTRRTSSTREGRSAGSERSPSSRGSSRGERSSSHRSGYRASIAEAPTWTPRAAGASSRTSS